MTGTTRPPAEPATTATRLSTAPDEQHLPPPRSGIRRVLALVRRSRLRLTSMRTALALLLLLAVAAVPGSVLPQRALSEFKVQAYLRQHRTLGPIYDRLGLFHVFTSPWFAAVYLLLVLSLVGCLVPRLHLHARALICRPPAAPKRLDRLPHHACFDSQSSPIAVQAAAIATLPRKRWRVRQDSEPSGALTVSAEKGYLRETGNLLFHLALLLLLVAVAVGKLYSYQGTVVVGEGKGFCDTAAQFDNFTAGPLVDRTRLAPLCVDLKRFSATYTPSGVAAQFRADITYTSAANGPARSDRLEVNHPLRGDGDRLYLLGHGFSPQFTVRDAGGDVFDHIDAPFLPQDANLTSSGVLKLPDARPQQLAIEGVFTPTAALDSNGLLASASPVPTRPAIAIFVYRGDLGLDTGQPQSIYSLDQTQIAAGSLRRVATRTLLPGESIRLSDNTRITFDGYTQWANLQVSHDPAQRWVLLAAVLIVGGLLLSLRVRRRRLWLRISPSGHPSSVQAGGLARTEPGANAAEFTALVDHLRCNVAEICAGKPAP